MARKLGRGRAMKPGKHDIELQWGKSAKTEGPTDGLYKGQPCRPPSLHSCWEQSEEGQARGQGAARQSIVLWPLQALEACHEGANRVTLAHISLRLAWHRGKIQRGFAAFLSVHGCGCDLGTE